MGKIFSSFLMFFVLLTCVPIHKKTYAFTYDSLSRLTGASITPSGSSEVENSLTFGYDALGQLLNSSVILSGSEESHAITYQYDSAGRKTSLTDPTGSTSYGFDKANRLTSILDPQSNSFTIAYDKAGRRTSLRGSSSQTAGEGDRSSKGLTTKILNGLFHLLFLNFLVLETRKGRYG